MQIKIFRKDDLNNKLRTRRLYEENFDIGDKNFVDYYYDMIIKRNDVAVIEDEGSHEIISMIHLNPYLYNIFGKVKLVHYLVAIATKKEYRKMGYMTMLFDYVIKYLRDFKEPFCYLVPENEGVVSFYKKLGFEKVCKFTLDKFSKKEYDIYPDYNEEYNKLMIAEDEFLKESSDDYIEQLSKKDVYFKLFDNYLSIDELKNKRIYICQEV